MSDIGNDRVDGADVVIVEGGSAEGVLAGGLSEDPARSIPQPDTGPTAGVNANAVLAIVAVAPFMVILDASIVNVALPTIRRDALVCALPGGAVLRISRARGCRRPPGTHQPGTLIGATQAKVATL